MASQELLLWLARNFSRAIWDAKNQHFKAGPHTLLDTLDLRAVVSEVLRKGAHHEAIEEDFRKFQADRATD